MALFKILKGNEANLPSDKHEGWAYVTEKGNMYVDLSNDKRVKIGNRADSAEFADKATGDTKPIRDIYLAKLAQVESTGSKFTFRGITGGGDNAPDLISIPLAGDLAGLISNTAQTIKGAKTFANGIAFPGVSSTTYPATSQGLSWTGSTDGAKIYYEVQASDKGMLIVESRDDTNAGAIFRNSSSKKEVSIINGLVTGSFKGNLSGTASHATSDANGKNIASYVASVLAQSDNRTIRVTKGDGTTNDVKLYFAASSSFGGAANSANVLNINNTENIGVGRMQFFQKSGDATLMPDTDWWSLVRLQHGGYASTGYWTEMAYAFHSNTIKFRRNQNGTKSAWKTIAFTDGTIAKATQAEKDWLGQVIDETYMKYPLSIKGEVITMTRGDGVTSTITVPDTKVTQTAVKASDYTNWRPIVWGSSNSGTEGFTPTTVRDQVYTAQTLSVQPSSGTIRATTFKGALKGNADTATNATYAEKDKEGNVIADSYVSTIVQNSSTGTAFSFKGVSANGDARPNTISIPAASATVAGLVTNAAQTFAGVKTFKNNIDVKGKVIIDLNGNKVEIGSDNKSYFHFLVRGQAVTPLTFWFGGPIQTAGNITPYGHNTYNLGSSSSRWKTGYFGSGGINVSGTITDKDANELRAKLFVSTLYAKTSTGSSFIIGGKNTAGDEITTLTIPNASTTSVGLITNAAQTLAGNKTLNNDLYVKGKVAVSASSANGYNLYVNGTSYFVGDVTLKANICLEDKSANRLLFSDENKKIATGSHYATSSQLGINTTNTSHIGNYSLFVEDSGTGTARFAIGTSDLVADKKFIIGSPGNRYLSFGGSGVQAYDASNKASTFYINYNGGNFQVGSSASLYSVFTLWGGLTIKGTTSTMGSVGFNYEGIGAAADDVHRVIWFAYNGRNGTPVYDTDFVYNPHTKKKELKVKRILISDTTSGNYIKFARNSYGYILGGGTDASISINPSGNNGSAYSVLTIAQKSVFSDMGDVAVDLGRTDKYWKTLYINNIYIKGTTKERLMWVDINGLVNSSYHYAATDRIAINYTSKPSYNFYVSGTTYLSGNLTYAAATANMMLWTDGSKIVKGSNHYVTTDRIAVNSTSKPSYNFYVNGTTHLSGNVTLAGQNANRLVWTDKNKILNASSHYASSTQVGVGTTNTTAIGDFIFYVEGASKINSSLTVNGQIYGSLASNKVDITVGGNANTYYPVVINSNPTSHYAGTLLSITRGYSETAPNSWNTSTHRGGLTLTILWNGSRYWDGNGAGSFDVHTTNILQLKETYTTMVAGLDSSNTGLVVWLRGGGAIYHIYSQRGTLLTATVYTSTYTDGVPRSFAPKTAVDSDNLNKKRHWVVRGGDTMLGTLTTRDLIPSSNNAYTVGNSTSKYLSAHTYTFYAYSRFTTIDGEGAAKFYAVNDGKLYALNVGLGVDPDTNYRLKITGNAYLNGIIYFANGTTNYINNSANARLNTLGLNGTNTSYRLYVNGTSYFTGAITHGAETANRLMWTDGNKIVKAANHYANTAKIAVNYTTEPTENFYVAGTSRFTNTIRLESQNKVGLIFRQGTGYDTTLSYQTEGNEALVFATKNAVTSFIFVNGEDSATNMAANRWRSLTPALQIKQNSVYIGSLVNSGTTPGYKFYVNGTSYFSNTITTPKSTGTHLAGNQGTGAIINSTAAGTGYNMLARMKSTNGVWTFGSHGTSFNFYYTVDTVISAGTNKVTKTLTLLNESGNSTFPGTVTAPKFSGTFSGALQGDVANASFRTTDGTVAYILVKINSSQINWMSAFTLRVYQSYNHYDVTFSGYQYGTSYWYSPQATLTSSTVTNLAVYFGYNSTTEMWVAIPGGNYTGAKIINVVNGYQPFTNISSAFSITRVASLPGTLQKSMTIYRQWIRGESVTSAVWNDYAECRKSDTQEPGYVMFEKGDDSLSKTIERLQHFAGIVSDTWGFSQGETTDAKTNIAVAGRVLAYPYRDRNEYKPGDCVCAAPGGKVDIMTREEIVQYPDRIVGTVSCVPEYEEWGGGESADRDPVKVNGRIWIKVH